MLGSSVVFGIRETSAFGDTLDDRIRVAAASGYDYIDMETGEEDDSIRRLEWSKDARLSLHGLCMEQGVFIRSVTLNGLRRFPIGDTDPKRRLLGMELLRRAIFFCNSMGIRIIRLPSTVTTGECTEENISFYMENFCIALHYAAQGQVLLACPVVPDGFFSTDRYTKLKDVCATPWMTASVDVGTLFSRVSENSERNSWLMSVYKDLIDVTLSQKDGGFHNIVFTDDSPDLKRAAECLFTLNYCGAFLLDTPSGGVEELTAARETVLGHMRNAGYFGKAESPTGMLLNSFLKIQR